MARDKLTLTKDDQNVERNNKVVVRLTLTKDDQNDKTKQLPKLRDFKYFSDAKNKPNCN